MFTGSDTHGLAGQITVLVDCEPTTLEPAYQPMSRSWLGVRSSSLCRSALMAGSITAFGVSEMSQCETDEPLVNGFGVYILIRLAASAPACTVELRRIVTFTPFA